MVQNPDDADVLKDGAGRHLELRDAPDLSYGTRPGDEGEPDFPLGVELEVFIRCEDAERSIEEVLGDEPEIAEKLRIEERELEAGGLN